MQTAVNFLSLCLCECIERFYFSSLQTAVTRASGTQPVSTFQMFPVCDVYEASPISLSHW